MQRTQRERAAQSDTLDVLAEHYDPPPLGGSRSAGFPLRSLRLRSTMQKDPTSLRGSTSRASSLSSRQPAGRQRALQFWGGKAAGGGSRIAKQETRPRGLWRRRSRSGAGRLRCGSGLGRKGVSTPGGAWGTETEVLSPKSSNVLKLKPLRSPRSRGACRGSERSLQGKCHV